MHAQVQEAEAKKRKRPKAPVGLGQLAAKKKKGTKGISSMIDKWQAVRKEEVCCTWALNCAHCVCVICYSSAAWLFSQHGVSVNRLRDCTLQCTVSLPVLLADLYATQASQIRCGRSVSFCCFPVKNCRQPRLILPSSSMADGASTGTTPCL